MRRKCPSNTISIRCAVAICFLWTVVSAAAVQEWSYSNPDAWPGVCKSGHSQSPLDFRAGTGDGRYVIPDSRLSPLYLSPGCKFEPSEYMLYLHNTVNALHVKFEPRPNASDGRPRCFALDPVMKQRYEMSFITFHVKGEHRFAGDEQDAEIDVVFERIDPEMSSTPLILTLAVPLRIAKRAQSSELFDTILADDAALPAKGAILTKPLAKTTPLDALLPSWDGGYISYQGSLTFPPCTEGVHWIVFTSFQYISRTAYNNLNRDLSNVIRNFTASGNARPTQPYNGRVAKRFLDPFASSKAHWILHQDEDAAYEAYRNGSTRIHPYFTAVNKRQQSNGGFVDMTFLLVILILFSGAVGCFIQFRSASDRRVSRAALAEHDATTTSAHGGYGTMRGQANRL